MSTEKQNMPTNNITRTDTQILAMLLKDQTHSQGGKTENLVWATADYGFPSDSPITPIHFTGDNKASIQPRVYKHPSIQASRSKSRAEVFTPAWLCNHQNNLIDEQWFGQSDVFNTITNLPDGTHSWQPTQKPIEFPEGKTWKQYIRCRRMEVTCGEAPYIASRYDTTTGEPIDLNRRIGMFDRKMRIINENTPSEPTKNNKRHWLRKAYQALQAIYGFDLQGDNVFLSRETLFSSFCEYYQNRWQQMPHHRAMMKAAEIISWNIWQMDGTNGTRPGTNEPCIIMEWHGTEPLRGKTVVFKQLTNKKK